MKDINYDLKKEIIEEAKKLASQNIDAQTLALKSELVAKWKKTKNNESLLDEELDNEFFHYLSQINEKQDEIRHLVVDKKKELIKQAKVVSLKQDSKKTFDEMDELMNQWKNQGRASKQEEDELWNEFKEIRNEVYKRKNEYYKNLRDQFEKAQTIKEALISETKLAIEQIEDIKELTSKMDDIMDRWKAAGFASRAINDELWEKFKELRKVYFSKRSEYFKGLASVYEAKKDEKRSLITIARKNLAMSTFDQDEVEEMKQLRTKWKEIGYSGKEESDELWQEFDSIIKKYFDNKKYYG